MHRAAWDRGNPCDCCDCHTNELTIVFSPKLLITEPGLKLVWKAAASNCPWLPPSSSLKPTTVTRVTRGHASRPEIRQAAGRRGACSLHGKARGAGAGGLAGATLLRPRFRVFRVYRVCRFMGLKGFRFRVEGSGGWRHHWRLPPWLNIVLLFDTSTCDFMVACRGQAPSKKSSTSGFRVASSMHPPSLAIQSVWKCRL